MRWQIHLEDEHGKRIMVAESHKTQEICLQITFTHGAFYREHLGPRGLRELYDKKAGACIPILEKAIAAAVAAQDPKRWSLDSHYWLIAAGTGAALQDLLTLAKLCPDAKFVGGW